MTWFQDLTGVEEGSYSQVQAALIVDGNRLYSTANGQSWQWGELKTPSLGELRKRARATVTTTGPTKLSEVVANVQHLHADAANKHVLFQVASQFNLLEMVSPHVTPEDGVGTYERDRTQGPACAIAAGAGTIYRNYFVPLEDKVGQTTQHQIDCLADIGALLGNNDGRLWRMTNGYALPSKEGLVEINRLLTSMNELARDKLRQALRIGLQWDTQVTLAGATHTVSQAYCSALPVAYSPHASELWEPFARLVLEAAYEATFAAAVLNRERTGCSRVYLTLLGGGAFGNCSAWILDAIRRAIELYYDSALEVYFVSYGTADPRVRELLRS